MKKAFLFPSLFFSLFLFSQTPKQLADSLKSGFRGLSVVNKDVVWMSGRKGLVGVITNASAHGSDWKWKWYQVKGYEHSDFRSIYAFDKKSAVIATAGTPAAILRTNNAGKTWTECYRSNDSAMFFDGIDFWDQSHGIIFGDPVNGRMYLSETFDGGKTWKEIPAADRPQLEKGEASFAASGTTIRVAPGGHVWIATGGTVSRLWHSRDFGHHWQVMNTPILQGKPSQGIFSFAFYDTLHGVIVGGDYLNDTLKKDHVFLTEDGGKTWHAPKIPTGGYRSCVEYINDRKLVAIGPGGINESNDSGRTWQTMEGFYGNTIRVVKNAPTYFSCGGMGFTHTTYSAEVYPGDSVIH